MARLGRNTARPVDWVGRVHLIASITQIAAAIALVFGLDEPRWALAIVAYMCFLLAVSWILLFLQQYRFARQAGYAEATTSLHGALHELRDASFSRFAYLDRETADPDAIDSAVSHIATMFSQIVGRTCRVSVKAIKYTGASLQPGERADPHLLEVYDLSRSDGTTPHRARPDRVDENTDFEEIFEGDQQYFFSNDLVKLLRKGLYKNSHWTREVIERETYPYVATIVYPIRKALPNPQVGIAPDLDPSLHPVSPTQDLIGFLCVDCRVRDVFDRDFDVPIVAALADTLYAVLRPSWKEE